MVEERELVEKHNKNKRTELIFFTCLILLCSSVTLFLGNYMATKGVFLVKTSDDVIKSTATQINDTEKYAALFAVRDTLIEKFDGEIDDNKLLEGAIKGMTDSLDDPYTVFMNKEEFDKLMNQSKGAMKGIGVTVTSKDNEVYIVSIVKGSPAENAGLKAEDVIQKIDGTEYKGEELSDAVEAIGNANGNILKFTIKRGEETFDVDITPEEFKVSVVEGEMIDSSVGYIKLDSFMNENLTEDFKAEIEELKNQGMKSLILDLRENPGGLLTQAVGVASQFIKEGDIITYTVDKYGNKNDSVSTGGIAEGMPLTVLVNGNSASASEVVTGALRDYNAATIVGETTFGKGIVQQTMKFNNDIGGLKVTISKYYTPNGENIHKTGITPEFEVTTEKGINEAGYDRNTDEQLKTAIEKAKEKLQ